MKTNGADEEDGTADVLTEKQRLVLDLLIENKTSKEIGRALGISPYTVDQRISLARGKLGAASRSELATRYRKMRRPSGLRPPPALPLAGENRAEGFAGEDLADRVQAVEGAEKPAMLPNSVLGAGKKDFPTLSRIDHRVGPEVFEGRHGGLWRFGAVVMTALLLVMTILGLFAIFDQLNSMLA